MLGNEIVEIIKSLTVICCESFRSKQLIKGELIRIRKLYASPERNRSFPLTYTGYIIRIKDGKEYHLRFTEDTLPFKEPSKTAKILFNKLSG